ncbi:ERF family protein [Nonomuraea sp. NPDC023979]|uniref:ERF family protein n=1 Tax=Nonomuraea sp. NPDC023979 TaxID=3154796 RepID=UPI0034002DF7
MAADTPAPKTLDEALLILQADPPVLEKNKQGQVGNQKTRYADLVQVNAVVLSRLNELGCVYTTKPTLRADDPKFVLQYSLKHVASGTENSGEYPLKLSENPMQMGSAITYARRYVLLAITGIAAEDEDDDGQAAHGRTAQRAHRQTPTTHGHSVPAPTAQRARQQSVPPTGSAITEAQQQKLGALMREHGITDRASALALVNEVLQRPDDNQVTSRAELTRAEASQVIDRLQREADQPATSPTPAETS